MARRVVVTGIGLVTPIAVGTEETWQGLLAGKSGIGPITHFDHTAFATHFAGEVKDFDPTRWMTSREAKTLDPFIRYAVAAGALAVADSGLEITGEFAERVGCFVGAGLGGVTTIEATCKTLPEKGPRHGFSPFFVPMIIVNLAAGNLSIRYGAKGPNLSQVSACSTGAHAIGDAFRVIQRGDADAMICGGTEATVTPLGVGGFNAMRALSTRNDAPQQASRPFDKDRDGFVMAEGRGHPGDRGAGARQGARREDLRRAARLRRQRRRAPHHLAGAGGRGRAALHAARAQGRGAARRRTSATSTRTGRRRR